MPYHKSFADFTILFSTHLLQKLPNMFFLGVDEDIPKIEVFTRWMKQCGYVFLKRSED